MTRSYTARLILKRDVHGAEIVCSMPPFEGKPVIHAPRHSKDGQPWILATQANEKFPFRYSGDECHAIPGESGVNDCECCGQCIMVNNIHRVDYCDECEDESCNVDHNAEACESCDGRGIGDDMTECEDCDGTGVQI